VLFGVLGVAAFIVLAGFLIANRGAKSVKVEQPESVTSLPELSNKSAPVKPLVKKSNAAPAVAASPRPRPSAGTAEMGEVTAQTRELVSNLITGFTNGVALTPEQINGWKQNFQQIVQQGATAVPAIDEFLKKNMDLDFGKEGKGSLGYTSARSALFDALGQIGGPQAVAALSGTLENTADPREIAALAQNLERLEPGVHQQQILTAAREALSMASEGKLTDRDVAPVFEVLQRYGDSATVAELSNNSKGWNYYSMMALAQLPDGAGIPSLVQIVTGQDSAGGGSKAAAVQMLAQVAAESEVARNALLDQVKNNKLTAYNWATLAPILAGDQLHFRDSVLTDSETGASSTETQSSHITSGNQNFYTAPTPETLTPDRLNEQAKLIDQLIAATSDPTALEALNRAKTRVSQRLSQVSAATPKQ